MSPYALMVITPEKIIFDALIHSLVVPGADGYFQILGHHAPLIALLKPGEVTLIDQDEQPHVFITTGGLVHVSRNQATLIADSIEAVH